MNESTATTLPQIRCSSDLGKIRRTMIRMKRQMRRRGEPFAASADILLERDACSSNELSPHELRAVRDQLNDEFGPSGLKVVQIDVMSIHHWDIVPRQESFVQWDVRIWV